MLPRVLTWIGGLLTLAFAAWLISDVVVNGIDDLARLPVVAGAVGTLAGLLLMWAAVAKGHKDDGRSGHSVSIRGGNLGIVSTGDNVTNTQQHREGA